MSSSLERHDAYSVIEKQAHGQGVSPDKLVEHKLGLAVFREAEESGDNEQFGTGNVVILEITGGVNPNIVARALVETLEDVPAYAAKIKRAKHIPDSSVLFAYHLPPVKNVDLEVGDVVFETHPQREPIGQHAVFPKPSTHWVGGKKP